MALATRQEGSYISKYAFPLPKYIDAARFRRAWQRTLLLCTNLRTRMVFFGGSSYQVVVEEPVVWDETLGSTVGSAINAMNTAKMTYGSKLCRYGLAKGSDDQDYFIWLIHHSIYDGWSMRLIVETLHRLYYGAEIPPMSPFSGIIDYVQNMDLESTGVYWKTQLADAKRPTFPLIPSDMTTSSTNNGAAGTVTRLENHMIPLQDSTGVALTKATVMRAAWALLLARYCDSDDVCFGTTVSGRQAPVRGVQRIPGPLIASVPTGFSATQTLPAFAYCFL
ncbi:condensation domain-containing protein [Colletotrichum phormii]|uniref:Condensation domain-containing protein n=1 Tax=Colletotrichum phormii TaxID=359342 RepID=A0AAJ0EA56_9PEZI|nr:condensation domain-containing protein [Colletotrichum phormii]KAK1624734.1 condensation domain-containing protein [Colletotrichum phormii]